MDAAVTCRRHPRRCSLQVQDTVIRWLFGSGHLGMIVGVMTMVVRDGVVGDLEVLREVFCRASLANPGDREVLLANPEVLVWSGESLAEGRTRVAVTGDGSAAGFATVETSGDGWDLEDLFVLPELMRHGVGRRLIEDVFDRARGYGLSSVTVTANPHAMAFYTAVGFVPDGVAQTQFGPATRMRLDVAAQSLPQAQTAAPHRPAAQPG